MTRTNGFTSSFSFICAAAVLGLSLALASAFQGPPDELDQIRNAIAAKGARWHADETSMSMLSQEERRMRLGMDEREGFGKIAEAPVPTLTAAPPAMDYRTDTGISYVSPVKNQGSCGSCWAFAVTAALESQVMMALGGQAVDLSEQILVSCSGAGSCSGGSPSSASTYIQNVGLPVEGCFPYTATNNSCTNACANWQLDTDMVNGWHSVSPSVDNIRNAVYAYGPVLATMYVYNDFYSYRSGVYSYTSGAYVGAHAVLVVGYDDVSQSFLVKNSWGTGWGEAGFFHIAYTEVGGTSRFGYSLLAYDGYKGVAPPPDTIAPTATVSSPSAGATVSGTTTVNISATDNVGVTSVSLYLDNTLSGTKTSAPFSFSWNTQSAANGNHVIQAVASDAARNSVTTSPVSVNVNNVPDSTPPVVAISSPANASTVSKVVKVKASATDSKAVQRLEAYDGTTLIGSAACSSTTCSATFNWNTNSVVKGPHTITVFAYDNASNKGNATASVTVK